MLEATAGQALSLSAALLPSCSAVRCSSAGLTSSVPRAPLDAAVPCISGALQTQQYARHVHHPQVAATFSAGSAVAVLGGGFLFCRVQAAGRRNLTFLLCAMTAGVPPPPPCSTAPAAARSAAHSVLWLRQRTKRDVNQLHIP